MSFNQVTIVGNLGADPELRYTPSNVPVATLSVATNERWTDKSGEKKEHTEWHRVILWNKQAENAAKYLKKGSKALVVGSLRTRSWEDKQGAKRYTTEIQASQLTFLDPVSTGNRAPHPADDQAPTASTAGNGYDPGNPPALDDIPF